MAKRDNRIKNQNTQIKYWTITMALCTMQSMCEYEIEVLRRKGKFNHDN